MDGWMDGWDGWRWGSEGKRKEKKKILQQIRFSIEKLYRPTVYTFLLTVKLLMLSSKISVHLHLFSFDFLSSTPIVAIPAVNVDIDEDGVVLSGSTSTTRTTALPSSTFRTLSTSQSLFDLPDKGDNEEAVEEECPLKASQNALPSFLNRV